MKLCITAHGRDLDAPVDERFGRAEVFLLLETDSMETEVLENAGAADSHGVGIASATLISRAGATALLTGHCGPKALEVLRGAGVRVFNGAYGTVGETVDAYLRGELKEAMGPEGTR